MTEEQKPQADLNPLYQPALEDDWIKVHFIGNTPVISGFSGSPRITPYHFLAAVEDMKRKAFQMIQYAEIEEAKAQQKAAAMGIQTPGSESIKLPPGGFRPGA